MTHRAQLGWIGRTQKTVKTECGKRVACSQIAINADADCPACRAAVDNSCAALVKIADLFVQQHGEDNKIAADARAVAADPRRYQTTYYFL